jgi:hypothetical protein
MTNPTKETMSAKQKVLKVWPDAKLSSAFAKQPDGTKQWMWCVMSTLRCRSSRGKKRVENVGEWRFSEAEAWTDAAAQAAQERVSDLELMVKKLRDFIEFGPVCSTEATNIVLEADEVLRDLRQK